jgi:hypothetical protein
MTMVSNGGFKIIGSDWGKECKRAKKVEVTRGNENFQIGTRSDASCRFSRAAKPSRYGLLCSLGCRIREPFGLIAWELPVSLRRCAAVRPEWETVYSAPDLAGSCTSSAHTTLPG